MPSQTNSSRRRLPEMDFERYADFLMIRDKNGRTVPFTMNAHQHRTRAIKRRAYEDGRLGRFLMVKFRQWGGTTLEVAETDYLTGRFAGQYGLTMAHDLPTTIKIFEIADRYYKSMATQERVTSDGKPLFHWQRKAQNKRELEYPEADSRYFIGTAGNSHFGHGMTINKAHLSEAARFPNLSETLAALEGVPQDGEIVLESTPYGAQGPFYEMAQEAFRGENEWTLIFYCWFEDLQYQMATTPDEAAQILAEVANGSHPRFGNEEQALAQRLAAEKGLVLTAGQWKWRRWKRASLKEKFFEQYPEDFVSCWLASGRPVFDLLRIRATPDGVPIEKLEGGSLWVYEKPIAGRNYTLWMDPAEGIERGGDDDGADGTTIESANKGKTDYTAWGIIDDETNDDVAVFLGRITPAESARMANVYGRRYNDATAAVERNNHGHAVLLALRDIHGYPNIYHHTERENNDGTVESAAGFPTRKDTRSLMIDDLDTEIREGEYRVIDPRMKAQMTAFAFNAKGRAEATQGNHDDLVTGRAIGGQVRRLPRGYALAGFA